MEPVNSGFATVEKSVVTAFRKRNRSNVCEFYLSPQQHHSNRLLHLQGCDRNAGVVVLSSIRTCMTLAPVGSDQVWETSQGLLCSEISSQVKPYSRELVTLILFKDWVQWHSLSQCSRVPADQMCLQSLKVMFLEEMCMKIPVKAHKPWFIYMGISKCKSESVHKHWSFHTYMQAKYTKSNTFSERDLCKNMYSNCRPPSRHT